MGPVKAGPLGVTVAVGNLGEGVAVGVLAGMLDGVFATGVLAIVLVAVVLGADSGVAASP
jgi:hypothetical protein